MRRDFLAKVEAPPTVSEYPRFLRDWRLADAGECPINRAGEQLTINN
jgi:hypothetical protein